MGRSCRCFSCSQYALLTFLRQIYEIAQGLAYLHENDIVHGNLTVDSIVIVKNKAQITDLQYACVDNEDRDVDKDSNSIYQGSRRHNLLAPEINYPDIFGRMSSRPRKSSDIYSFACVLTEVCMLSLGQTSQIADSISLAVHLQGTIF